MPDSTAAPSRGSVLVATLSLRESGADPEALAQAEAVLAQLGPDLTTSC